MNFKMRILLKALKSRKGYALKRTFNTQPSYIYPKKEDEYSNVPLYPRINERDYDSEEVKTLREWHDKIKRQLTVEEKLYEVNVPRRFGWKCYMVEEGVIPFDNLTFAQHMTKTHVVETEKLPGFDRLSDKASNLCSQIKNDVIDALEYQLDIRHHKISEVTDPIQREKEITKRIVSELNRIISSSLWDSESYLKQVQVDYSPRIEASWKINSLVETFVPKKFKYGLPLEEIPEEYLGRPSDKYIQYVGQPILQLRHSTPLPSVVDFSDGNILSYSVPKYEYDPHVALNYELKRRYMTNIPGFWPGDDREFSFLSYHCTNHLKKRPPSYGEEDRLEALKSQAIFASFGWLMPIACYQGFSSYHDLTYPLVTQTVLTDGKEFSFALYQMNTSEMYHEYIYNNPKSNICWITPNISLYEAIEDGKLKGVNDEVILQLLKLYLNEPKALSCNPKPYLGEKIKHIADFEDDEKCEWLNLSYKRVCAQVVGNKHPMYEVYDWERIYKIQFRMRPRDARKRPFELRQNPYHEKLSDFKGHYIPKHLRPDKLLPKWRQRKFAKTFFPQ